MSSERLVTTVDASPPYVVTMAVPGDDLAAPTLYPRSAFDVVRGSSTSVTFTVTTPDGERFDLTDHTILLTVVPEDGGSAVIRKRTAGRGIEFQDSNPRLGVVTVSFDPADTASLAGSRFLYDLWAVTESTRLCLVRPTYLRITPRCTELP